MEKYPFDSRSPAPGVRVAPYIANRAQGLSMSQVKAMRQTNATTPHHLRGGPVPVGMRSITQSAGSFIKPTRPTRIHRTPGAKTTRGTTSRGPQNTVFQGRIKSTREVSMRQAESQLIRLKRYHAGLVCDVNADEVDWLDYRLKRNEFVDKYPLMAKRLQTAEVEHHRSLAR